MSQQTIQLQLTESQTDSCSAGGRTFVHLEQIGQTATDSTASMFDIKQMVARAKSGVSALTYMRSDCTAHVVGDNIVVTFSFYVWPSSREFQYHLSSTIGVLSDPSITEDYTEFSMLFGLTGSVGLDFILTEINNVKWETPCYDRNGQEIPDVALTIKDDNTICAEREVFGVVRIRGRKWGRQHSLVVTLPKEDLSISNLQAYVTADWGDRTTTLDDSTSTDTLKLEVPQCVEDMLAMCDGDQNSIENVLFNIMGGIANICGAISQSKRPRIAYYSECTGELIEVVVGDTDGWCS